jgi:hypothetical protein
VSSCEKAALRKLRARTPRRVAYSNAHQRTSHPPGSIWRFLKNPTSHSGTRKVSSVIAFADLRSLGFPAVHNVLLFSVFSVPLLFNFLPLFSSIVFPLLSIPPETARFF